MNVIVIAHKGQQALAKSLADGDAVLVTFSSLFIVQVNLSSLTQCFFTAVMPLSFPEIWASWLVKLAHEPRGMPRGGGIRTVMFCTVKTFHGKAHEFESQGLYKGFVWFCHVLCIPILAASIFSLETDFRTPCRGAVLPRRQHLPPEDGPHNPGVYFFRCQMKC